MAWNQHCWQPDECVQANQRSPPRLAHPLGLPPDLPSVAVQQPAAIGCALTCRIRGLHACAGNLGHQHPVVLRAAGQPRIRVALHRSQQDIHGSVCARLDRAARLHGVPQGAAGAAPLLIAGQLKVLQAASGVAIGVAMGQGAEQGAHWGWGAEHGAALGVWEAGRRPPTDAARPDTVAVLYWPAYLPGKTRAPQGPSS